MRKILILLLFVTYLTTFAQDANGFATFTPIITQPRVQQYVPPSIPVSYPPSSSNQNVNNYTNCNQIPPSFSSWKQAFVAISTCDFEYVDSFDAESTFITGGAFKSCDGNYGFVVVFIKGYYPYIYQNVPASVWKDFKNSESFGNYYNYNIKGRYKVYLK